MQRNDPYSYEYFKALEAGQSPTEARQRAENAVNRAKENKKAREEKRRNFVQDPRIVWKPERPDNPKIKWKEERPDNPKIKWKEERPDNPKIKWGKGIRWREGFPREVIKWHDRY